ncbi:MAG: hypothetical protein KDC80_08380 [Saprospiraceae bacterium]|nr:hypothetical protein [Saprospiraceae bacterium]
MISQIAKKTWMFALMILAVFSACNKDDSLSTDDVENYVDEVVFDMQREGNCGKFGCYEFVFPITIQFEDGTTVDVEDYAGLRETLRTYREENPDGARPTLAYPLEVMTEEGEVITVASQEELHELRVQCRRDFFNSHGHRGHRFRGMFCFTLNFPLSVALPDGTTAEVADRMELKETLRTWKADNPDSEERPELVFPITVTMEDGTEVTVESKEALVELKESCSQ